MMSVNGSAQIRNPQNRTVRGRSSTLDLDISVHLADPRPPEYPTSVPLFVLVGFEFDLQMILFLRSLHL